MGNALENLLIAMGRNPSLMAGRLLATIEIGKIERAYQDYSMPSIFLKQYDRFGLIKNYGINQFYNGSIPFPRSSYHSDEGISFLNRVASDCDLQYKLRAMLVMNLTEKAVLSHLTSDFQEQNPPLIKREFDLEGIPVVYSNNNIVNIAVSTTLLIPEKVM